MILARPVAATQRMGLFPGDPDPLDMISSRKLSSKGTRRSSWNSISLYKLQGPSVKAPGMEETKAREKGWAMWGSEPET